MTTCSLEECNVPVERSPRKSDTNQFCCYQHKRRFHSRLAYTRTSAPLKAERERKRREAAAPLVFSEEDCAPCLFYPERRTRWDYGTCRKRCGGKPILN